MADEDNELYLELYEAALSGVRYIGAEQLDIAESVASQAAFLTLQKENVLRPMAYVRIVARNLYYKELKFQSNEKAWDPDWLASLQLEADSEVARRLSEDHSASHVRKAMAYAAQTGDSIGLRVIGEWLALAESLGGKPPRNKVAEAASVSLPTVDAVLKRFKIYLESADLKEENENG